MQLVQAIAPCNLAEPSAGLRVHASERSITSATTGYELPVRAGISDAAIAEVFVAHIAMRVPPRRKHG
ncbi:hypothetical protein CQ393_07155 [Stenotrophomonas sp. MYb238]|uniref:hypothetical protein n=1 Tax=Stenotrophomonas sp. MYb238 TaxID=2040281 RepID=UPI0012924E01|nr:hypothetical protein [Stenotrophomonas sp. MYb238]MQP75668.1 hypothetical protein [Stenotrophomonas sp. MYb238]